MKRKGPDDSLGFFYSKLQYVQSNYLPYAYIKTTRP